MHTAFQTKIFKSDGITSKRLEETILPQCNVTKLATNDQELCIFSQEGLKVHPLHCPKDQPKFNVENPAIGK